MAGRTNVEEGVLFRATRSVATWSHRIRQVPAPDFDRVETDIAPMCP